jgi:hypothetical protein
LNCGNCPRGERCCSNTRCVSSPTCY